MADEKDLVEDEKIDETGDRKKKKKKERKRKQPKDSSGKNAQMDDEEEEEKAGGKLVLALVTVLIIAIWLGIIAILIKSDVGGFGSSVLYPILKDVPYTLFISLCP